MMVQRRYVSEVFSQLIHRFLVIEDESSKVSILVIERNHKVLRLVYNSHRMNYVVERVMMSKTINMMMLVLIDFVFGFTYHCITGYSND